MGISSNKLSTTISGNETNAKCIGKRILKLRRANGITQEMLAKMIFCDKSVVSLWEHGKRTPDVDMVVKLAKLFHVSVDYLLMGGDMATDECEQCCYQRTYLEIVEIISKYQFK